jgi:hypothetical protein
MSDELELNLDQGNRKRKDCISLGEDLIPDSVNPSQSTVSPSFPQADDEEMKKRKIVKVKRNSDDPRGKFENVIKLSQDFEKPNDFKKGQVELNTIVSAGSEESALSEKEKPAANKEIQTENSVQIITQTKITTTTIVFNSGSKVNNISNSGNKNEENSQLRSAEKVEKVEKESVSPKVIPQMSFPSLTKTPEENMKNPFKKVQTSMVTNPFANLNTNNNNNANNTTTNNTNTNKNDNANGITTNKQQPFPNPFSNLIANSSFANPFNKNTNPNPIPTFFPAAGTANQSNGFTFGTVNATTNPNWESDEEDAAAANPEEELRPTEDNSKLAQGTLEKINKLKKQTAEKENYVKFLKLGLEEFAIYDFDNKNYNKKGKGDLSIELTLNSNKDKMIAALVYRTATCFVLFQATVLKDITTLEVLEKNYQHIGMINKLFIVSNGKGKNASVKITFSSESNKQEFEKKWKDLNIMLGRNDLEIFKNIGEDINIK